MSLTYVPQACRRKPVYFENGRKHDYCSLTCARTATKSLCQVILSLSLVLEALNEYRPDLQENAEIHSSGTNPSILL
jgi:hypothetical protein